MTQETSSRFGPKGVGVAASKDVAAPLLDYLRTQRYASLAYAEPPSRITGGFDTTIFSFRLAAGEGDWAVPLILRIFRDGGVEQALFETAVQNAVAAQGYPAPRVLATCDDAAVLGGAFTIMPRVAGKPMIERLFSPAMPRIPVLLGQLQARLHALDPEPVRRALAGAGMEPERLGNTHEATWTDRIAESKLSGLVEASRWLDAHRQPPAERVVICHGDFHPLNVMMQRNDVTGVLDWAMMRIADPAWDVGAGMALFGQGPIDLPGPLMPAVNLVRRWLMRRYLKAYLAERPLDMQAVRYYEAMRLLGFMVEAGEYRQSRAGVIPPSTKATVFDAPRVVRGITRRFKQISGVEPQLPPPT